MGWALLFDEDIEDDSMSEPQRKLRRAVHLHTDTHSILSRIAHRANVSMSGLVHFLVTERAEDTLADAARTMRKRRRGRPRKSYHG